VSGLYDFGLMLVTDRTLSRGRSIEDIVAAAVRGGVTAVQLREKECPTREFLALARRLKDKLDAAGVPLLINDRADIALAVGAAGAHFGQDDLPFPDARRLLGPDAAIGISIERPGQAVEADGWDVSYLGVSPVFTTPTKTDMKSPWGLDGLRRLRTLTRHRLVAIGGISAANAAHVLEAGADGLAVVSAICSADDPEAAARALRGILDRSRADKGKR
jgi:thiamine-phosphate pyrophosphorylase